MLANGAIATLPSAHTAAAALAEIELLKLLQSKPLHLFTRSALALAAPALTADQLAPPPRKRSVDFDPVSGGPLRALPELFSPWDHIVVRGPLTLAQFIDKFKVRSVILRTDPGPWFFLPPQNYKTNPSLLRCRSPLSILA